jgi:hypothetical protein
MAEDHQQSIHDLLASVDAGLREMAPKNFTPAAEPHVEPSSEVADLTGDVLRKAASDFIETTMRSLAEAEAEQKARRLNTETAMNNLRTFIDMMATQNTEVVNICLAAEKTVKDFAERIMAVGKPPPNSNGKGD